MDAPPPRIYPLSLHDALPISVAGPVCRATPCVSSTRTTDSDGSGRSENESRTAAGPAPSRAPATGRSEEHTSELQSLTNLVCRLLLEKKKKDKHREQPRRIHG